MNFYQSVAPSTYIVSLTEAKNELAIDGTGQDTRLTLKLGSTRDFIENQTNICFTNQTWVQTYGCFPDCIKAVKVPVLTLTIQYYDEDNTLQTLDSTDYYILKNGMKCLVVPKDEWPNTYGRPEAVIVTTACGMSTIPDIAKALNLKLLAIENEDREGAYLNQTSLGVDRYITALRKGFTC